MSRTLVHFGSPEGTQFTPPSIDTAEYAKQIGLILPGEEDNR